MEFTRTFRKYSLEGSSIPPSMRASYCLRRIAAFIFLKNLGYSK
jgi:hypothetical protein